MSWKPPFKVAPLEYSDELVREAIKKILLDYKGIPAVVLPYLDQEAKSGFVEDSTPYFRFVMGNILRDLSGGRIAPITTSQSEIALSYNILEKSYNEDLGLVVFPEESTPSNPFLFEHLKEQAKERIDLDLNVPFVITGLVNVVKNELFENYLRIDLTELSELYNVSILDKKRGGGYFNPKDPSLKESGFPSVLLDSSEGNRELYISKEDFRGVFRLVRGYDLTLYMFKDLCSSSGDYITQVSEKNN